MAYFMLSDTHPDAERVQIELARRSAPAEKVAQVCALSEMAVRLSRRAIARANPGLSQQEVDWKWVELNYGRELAEALRRYSGDRPT